MPTNENQVDMVDHVYQDDRLSFNRSSARRSAKRIIPTVTSFLPVASVLDVGCAYGAWVRAWAESGVDDYYGIDGAYVDTDHLLFDRSRYVAHDLTASFDLNRQFDIVQSVEVAEHLPAERAAGFVADLVAHAPAVLFSAAPPGQGGEHHVNEQPYAYWFRLFQNHGYQCLDCIRPAIRHDRRISNWYRYNTFLYVSDKIFSSLPEHVIATHIASADRIKDYSPPLYRVRKFVVRCLPPPVRELLARLKSRLFR